MLSDTKPYSRIDEIKKWIPSLILLPLCIYFVLNRGEYTLLDNANLVIHEAGHFFFILFGKFIYTLGGTLMQVILPSIIIWYFFSTRYRLGMQIFLFWLGHNFINISVYAADAQTRKLPLLGGSKVYHDWHYMLGELGILQYDEIVGYFFFGIAIFIFIITLLLPLIIRE